MLLSFARLSMVPIINMRGSGSCFGPWLILSDFNCIANFNERIGKAMRLSEVEPLRSYIANCDIHYMKSTGHFYTWNNK